MNIYGIESESAGWATIEASEPECPYCHGHHTRFVDFDFTNIDDLTHEKHFCLFCEMPFDVAIDTQFLEKNPCHSK